MLICLLACLLTYLLTIYHTIHYTIYYTILYYTILFTILFSILYYPILYYTLLYKPIKGNLGGTLGGTLGELFGGSPRPAETAARFLRENSRGNFRGITRPAENRAANCLAITGTPKPSLSENNLWAIENIPQVAPACPNRRFITLLVASASQEVPAPVCHVFAR